MQTATRFSALTQGHITRRCDCGNEIGAGNFSGLCWDCLAKIPATCGDCDAEIEGLTSADECGGAFICDKCAAAADEDDEDDEDDE